MDIFGPEFLEIASLGRPEALTEKARAFLALLYKPNFDDLAQNACYYWIENHTDNISDAEIIAAFAAAPPREPETEGLKYFWEVNHEMSESWLGPGKATYRRFATLTKRVLWPLLIFFFPPSSKLYCFFDSLIPHCMDERSLPKYLQDTKDSRRYDKPVGCIQCNSGNGLCYWHFPSFEECLRVNIEFYRHKYWEQVNSSPAELRRLEEWSGQGMLLYFISNAKNALLPSKKYPPGYADLPCHNDSDCEKCGFSTREGESNLNGNDLPTNVFHVWDYSFLETPDMLERYQEFKYIEDALDESLNEIDGLDFLFYPYGPDFQRRPLFYNYIRRLKRFTKDPENRSNPQEIKEAKERYFNGSTPDHDGFDEQTEWPYEEDTDSEWVGKAGGGDLMLMDLEYETVGGGTATKTAVISRMEWEEVMEMRRECIRRHQDGAGEETESEVVVGDPTGESSLFSKRIILTR